MQEEKKYSILDILAKSSGYDMALMTTFNFEIEFFERAVLNRLIAKDIKKVSLFVDSNELAKALNEFDIKHSGSHVGKKYMVTPVQINSSFHPKVILLLGEKRARLIIGSANIKTSGFAMNNEVFNYIDYSADDSKYLDVIVGAIDFFNDINTVSYQLDNGILKEAKNYIYYHRSEKNGEVQLFHNIKRSMLEQVKESVKGEVESICIAVPYYDKELKAIQALKDAYPSSEIHLYIQDVHSTFPVEYNEEHDIVQIIDSFRRFKNNSTVSSGNFYHGKVFQFKTKEADYVLYGSANCTQSAFVKTYGEGGNIECDLFETGSPDDFDYFFENMVLEETEKLTHQVMTFEAPSLSNYVYKYGEDRGDIELHLGFVKKDDSLKAFLAGNELKYRYEDDLIVVIPEESKHLLLNDIFEITLEYGGNSEVVRCWTYSPELLTANRQSQNDKEDLSGFDFGATGNNYIEDRIRYLKAEATCYSDWQEHQDTLKYMNQIRSEQEGDDGEADDFIVDFVIPDEYRYAYRQYNMALKIRGRFFRDFISTSFIIGDISGETKKASDPTDESEEVVRKPRKATTEEKRFERFIKGKVRGMLNDAYAEVIETEHYIGLIQVVVEIFDKYTTEEMVEDIFDEGYVIETKASFLLKVLNKSLDDVTDKEELQTAIFLKCFSMILENYAYYRALGDYDLKWKFEALNRGILFALEKKHSLRANYKQYLERLFQQDAGTGGLGLKESCAYIEQLYGYKTFEMLCDMISEVYENAEVERKGTSLYISMETDHIKDYLKPDTNILREIGRYSRSVNKISTVYIKIRNSAPTADNKFVLIEKKHTINMEYHYWRQEEYRADGSRYDSKSQYLSF